MSTGKDYSTSLGELVCHSFILLHLLAFAVEFICEHIALPTNGLDNRHSSCPSELESGVFMVGEGSLRPDNFYGWFFGMNLGLHPVALIFLASRPDLLAPSFSLAVC
jgi:hypothetical protein